MSRPFTLPLFAPVSIHFPLRGIIDKDSKRGVQQGWLVYLVCLILTGPCTTGEKVCPPLDGLSSPFFSRCNIFCNLETIPTSTESHHLGVSKNRGTPKWMVKIMENPIKTDDLGYPYFWKHPFHYSKTVNFPRNVLQNWMKLLTPWASWTWKPWIFWVDFFQATFRPCCLEAYSFQMITSRKGTVTFSRISVWFEHKVC